MLVSLNNRTLLSNKNQEMKATCINMEGHTEAFIRINVLFPKQGSGFTGVYYISLILSVCLKYIIIFKGGTWEICRMWEVFKRRVCG